METGWPTWNAAIASTFDTVYVQDGGSLTTGFRVRFVERVVDGGDATLRVAQRDLFHGHAHFAERVELLRIAVDDDGLSEEKERERVGRHLQLAVLVHVEVVRPDAVDDGPGKERVVRPPQPGHHQRPGIMLVGDLDGLRFAEEAEPFRALRSQRVGHRREPERIARGVVDLGAVENGGGAGHRPALVLQRPGLALAALHFGPIFPFRIVLELLGLVGELLRLVGQPFLLLGGERAALDDTLGDDLAGLMERQAL